MRIYNLIQYFEITANAVPERVAVIDGNVKLTFADLRRRVLAEAAAIGRVLVGKTNRVVAVRLPKSSDCIIADLAVLCSGNAYMNLDVKAPVARLDAILGNVRPAVFIGEKDGLRTDAIDFALGHAADASEAEGVDMAAGLGHIIDTDLCCLINTSGSTGVPKAVALNHRSFIDFVEAVRERSLAGIQDIVASLAPVVFDIFSFELCMLMAYGATLLLIPETLAAFPARMLTLMAEARASFLFWVPTIMVNIANMDLLAKIPLPALKTVWFAGEVFPTAKFNYWREKLPHALFANFYGPIEITIDCLYKIISAPLPEDAPLPIGKPFPNTSVLVLDADDHAISQDQPGLEGELCVRGSSLAAGYYNDPERTAAAFTQNPLNSAYPEMIYRTGDMVVYDEAGDLVFRGRRDSMIKHSGYRIELGEIERAAFKASPEILNVCAIYDTNAKKIVLFYEAREVLDAKYLRISLLEYLPRYMLPAEFVHLEAMPQNVNGKIDRQGLKDFYASGKGEGNV